MNLGGAFSAGKVTNEQRQRASNIHDLGNMAERILAGRNPTEASATIHSISHYIESLRFFCGCMQEWGIVDGEKSREQRAIDEDAFPNRINDPDVSLAYGKLIRMLPHYTGYEATSSWRRANLGGVLGFFTFTGNNSGTTMLLQKERELKALQGKGQAPAKIGAIPALSLDASIE